MATSAERMRHYRDRKKRGVLAVVSVEVSKQVVNALIDDGVFDGPDDEDLTLETLTEVIQGWVDEAAALTSSDT